MSSFSLAHTPTSHIRRHQHITQTQGLIQSILYWLKALQTAGYSVVHPYIYIRVCVCLLSDLRFRSTARPKLVQTTSAIKALWSLALEALFNEHYHLRPKADVSQTFQTTSHTHKQARNRPVFLHTS